MNYEYIIYNLFMSRENLVSRSLIQCVTQGEDSVVCSLCLNQRGTEDAQMLRLQGGN